MYRFSITLALILIFLALPRIFDEFREYDSAGRGRDFVGSNFAVEFTKAPSDDRLMEHVFVRGTEVEAARILPPYRDFAVAEPQLTASLALAVDLHGGFIFFRKGGDDQRWPIASLSKLITALVAEERIHDDAEIVISDAAISSEGATGNFSPGDIYSRDDMITAMLLLSSNDAAAALSERIGPEQFVSFMQQKASAIGMNDTIFIEATGLSAINQSTLTDLHKLMKHLYEYAPHLLELTARKSATIINLRNGERKVIHNINRFAGFSNFAGGKTGYLEDSKGNLVSLFEYRDLLIATIMLGSDDRFGETEKILEFIKNGYKF